MKYLKYIIEDEDVQNLVKSQELAIDFIYEDYKNFIIDMEYYVRNNLNQFIHETNTYNNIKKFALEKSLLYFQEGILGFADDMAKGFFHGVGTIGSIGGAAYLSYSWIKDQILTFWDSINPMKKMMVDVEDLVKDSTINKIVQKAADDPIVNDEVVQKVVDVPIEQPIDSAVNKLNPHLINPEPSNFIDSPFLTILAITSLLYTGKRLIDKYNDIRKTANLKQMINKSYDRLSALGINELDELRRLNQSKYEEHLNKCSDRTSPFGVLEINLTCPLDAYLTYCSSMLLSLCGVYLTKVSKNNDISKIDGMRGVLSIKDEFTMNQILTSIYNSFIDAIDFIYDEDVNITSKWKSILDNHIRIFIKQIPKQQSNSNQQSTYIKKDNYVRPNRPNYQPR